MPTFAIEVPCSVARIGEDAADYKASQITLRIVADSESNAVHRVTYALERIANSTFNTILPATDKPGEGDDAG